MHKKLSRPTSCLLAALRALGSLLLLGGAAAPPVLTIDHQPPAYMLAGSDLALVATVRPSSGVFQVNLHWRERGSRRFTRLEMESGPDDSYRAPIIAERVNGDVEYFLQVIDNTAFQSTTWRGAKSPQVVPLKSVAPEPSSIAPVASVAPTKTAAPEKPAVPVAAPPPAAPVRPVAPAASAAPPPVSPAASISTTEPAVAAEMPLTEDPEEVALAIRKLADDLAGSPRGQAARLRYRRWAMLPITEYGAQVEEHKLGAVLTDQLQSLLEKEHGQAFVERRRLGEIVREMELAQLGLVDEGLAPEIGKMAGAGALVVGSVGSLGDRFVVNARLVDASDGSVVATSSVSLSAAKLITLSSDSVVLRTRSDAVLRSLVVPGWGQLYNRQPEKAALVMVAGGGLAVGSLAFWLLGRAQESTYLGITPQAPGPCAAASTFSTCLTSQKAIGESQLATSRILLYALGGVWIANLVDAYFFGYEPDEQALKLYRAQLLVEPGGIAVAGTF